MGRCCCSLLTASHGIMATLLYGAGLRLMECLRLRVKDIEFSRSEVDVLRGLYTHVLNRGGRGVESPADRLLAAPRRAIAGETSRAIGASSGPIVEGNAWNHDESQLTSVTPPARYPARLGVGCGFHWYG
jgi:hypothetical protein